MHSFKLNLLLVAVLGSFAAATVAPGDPCVFEPILQLDCSADGQDIVRGLSHSLRQTSFGLMGFDTFSTELTTSPSPVILPSYYKHVADSDLVQSPGKVPAGW